MGLQFGVAQPLHSAHLLGADLLATTARTWQMIQLWASSITTLLVSLTYLRRECARPL
jgi:hypothetical protein